MKDLSRKLNIALIIITHNLGVVARYADRVNVMYAARLVEQGTRRRRVPPAAAIPTRMGLLRSVPRLDRPRGAKLETIEGLPPNLRDAAAGLPLRAALPASRSTICDAGAAALRRPTPAALSRLPSRTPRSRPARSPGRPAAPATAAADAARRRAAALDVAQSDQALPGRAAGFVRRARHGARGRGCHASTIQPRRDAGPGRRIRLRQDHGRPADPAARGADRRRDPLRGRRPRPRRAAEHEGDAPQDPGDLPGPLFVAQSAHDGRPDHRRAAARLQARRPTARPSASASRAAGAGRAASRTWRSAIRTSCPAASASASASRARSRWSRRFIVCDEAVSALDVSIQGQIINLLEDLQRRLGLAYLFIAHDLAVVRHISMRVVVMYLGRIMEVADRDELYAKPLHPYTKALLDAAPIPDPTVERARAPRALKGELPSPAQSADGLRLPYPLPDRRARNAGEIVPPLRRDSAWTHRGVHQSMTTRCNGSTGAGNDNERRKRMMKNGPRHSPARWRSRSPARSRRPTRSSPSAAARSTSRSAPRRRTTTATAATPTRRCISRRRSIRRCCASISTKFPEVEGDLAQVLDGRARPDDLHVQAAAEREIPRRHDADLGRRQGDLRPPAQSAAGRGVDPQGDLRRHRHDRDARPAHRRVQDEGGRTRRCSSTSPRRGTASTARQGLAADPTLPRAPRSTAPGPSPSSSTSRAATSPARRNDNYFKKGLPYLDGFKGIFTLQAAAMLNALQGGQVLAEFRGISPAERDRLVAGDGRQDPRSRSRAGRSTCWSCFNTEKKPFDDVRVRQALLHGDRPLGRRAGLSQDLDAAFGRRRDPARLAVRDAGGRAGQAAGLLQGHQEVARGGQEAARGSRRART